MHYLKILAISAILIVTGIEANAGAVQSESMNCTGEAIANCILAEATINTGESDTLLSEGGSIELAYLDTSKAIAQIATRHEDTRQATLAEVPMLSTIWLFGAALIGFVGISRRRSF